MSFATDVFRAFKRLRTDHGFVPAKAIGGSRFASLLRYEEMDICVSIYAKDTSERGTTIEMWVAPPDLPDDGLDNLNVGYKIWIGAQVSPDDDFFQGCESRIITLLSCIPALIPTIRQELENPAIKTRRWTVYQQQWDVVRIVHKLAAERQAGADKTLEKSLEYARGKLTLKEFNVECSRLAGEILTGNVLDLGARNFNSGGVDFLAGSLFRGLYAWGLGELSRRLRVTPKKRKNRG